jgi:putative two-component system response regulator
VKTGDTSGVPREQVRILIVDDEPANTEFLRHVLGPEGYGELVEITDAAEALERISEIRPDLVLLDLMMPDIDGYEFLDRMRAHVHPEDYLPVLVVTGDTSAAAQRRALSLGARDFVTKPLSPADIRLRVANLLETRFLQARLREYNLLLEDRVRERTQELEGARLEILNRLARAAEYRDDDTGQHTQRVGRIAARIAAHIGEPEESIELIRRAAPLHDIGKIGVPDSILLKPGRLSAKERTIMEDHTRIGADILSGSRFPLLRLAEEIALVHHERWDGQGYPQGLAGDMIPLVGRIVAVADVFDSLTHERPYKRAWSVKETLTEMQACSGTQFDPQMIEAMLRIAPEVAVLQDPAAEPRADDTVVELEPVTARVRALERERDELHREIRELREEMAIRDEQIASLSRAGAL